MCLRRMCTLLLLGEKFSICLLGSFGLYCCSSLLFFKKIIYLFIYLAVPGLSCGTQIFVAAWRIFSCSVWDLLVVACGLLVAAHEI